MKYKIGDNVILNDDVEFWFKKVGGYKVPIVDTTSCSYKIKIGENQYVYIDDNSINHEFTSKLNNKLKYKIGDRVVLGDAKTLKSINIDEEYAHETAIIDIISGNTYWVAVEKDGVKWNISDEKIDHEATARLNVPKYELKTDDNGVYFLEPLMNSTTNKDDIKKGSDKMNANEILEKWKSKRMCEIETECKNKKDQLTKEDEIVKLVEKHIAQINKTIKEKYDGVVNAVNVAVIRTPETDKKINLAEEEMSNKKLNIKKKIEEIKAVLEVAENQDKVFEILNKQGIIDKSYNIL